jgi:hypothetical protein
MSQSRSPRGPVAGGAILALSLTVGVVAGVALRQPSLGFLAGLIAGVAVALAIWLRDRRSDR